MSHIVIDGATITVLPPTAYAMAVHDADECAGRTCVIHSPTDHSMRHLPLHWRSDRGIFERHCPHGYGHPDPDQRAYWRHVASAGRPDWFGGWAEEPGQDPDEYVAGQMTHGCGCECCR